MESTSKLRIILSNYRYFISGGPERYLFSVKEILEDNSIEVFPFSVKSKNNIPNEWEDYFLSPVSTDDSAYFRDYKKNFKTLLKVLERSFYSPEGFVKARRYAKEVKANIVYSLHFLNKMSPSIIDGFKSAGIPVIVRLSDFGLICPQALLYREGNNCELCLNGSIFHSVRYKCIHNTFSGSLIKAFALRFHGFVGSISRIDAFVCPSKFTMEKYVKAGFPKEKLYHIPSFIDLKDIEPCFCHGGYILYFGRVSEEKGVHVLLEAYESLGHNKPKLIVIGNIGNSGYGDFLTKKYSEKVEFMDFIHKDKLYEFVRNAMFIVVPSICYDNMPNVVLESFAHGKAVIASRNGGFPNLIRDNDNGMLFETGNSNDLSGKLRWAINHPGAMIEFGKSARQYTIDNFLPETHLKRLLELFNKFI